MTDLEQLIYTRGLENLYGSVLLGEDPLNGIENLVYLTRELAGPVGSKHPVSTECDFIKRICKVCWPEMELTIEAEAPELNSMPIKRGSVAGPVCKAVFQVERRGGKPNQVILWKEADAVWFRVEEDGQSMIRGEIRDD